MAAEQERVMDSREEEVFSLWLIPKGEIADELSSLIVRLSREHSTPSFEPHVTLIGEINLPRPAAISRTRELAASIRSFDVRLNRVAHHDRYFQCVFLLADKTAEIMKAHSTACAVFQQKDTKEYMPHLSLLYGRLDAKTRQRVILDTGDMMNIIFRANEIFLYCTEGEPAAWHCLSRFQCGGNQ